MITEIEDYFAKGCGRCAKFETPACSVQHWAAGLAVLRRTCLDAGLTETVKWGHPCYMHAGRNIAIIGAFRTNLRFTFFNGSLLKDPDGVLEHHGPNSQYADMLRFTDNEAVQARVPIVIAYLQEAMGYAAAGIKPQKVAQKIDWPEELIEALDADPVLAEAFHALTPGRQKSYLLNLNGAKKAETRIARIAKFRDKIIAGKGALDR